MQNNKPIDSIGKQFNFFMFEFINHFLQGYIRTIPYIYKTLPSYNMMSLFNVALLPWSLKFILSPFLQKYYIKQYGKRKCWIILSQVMMSIFLFIASFLTQQSQILSFVIILIIVQIFGTIQNNCVEGLALKQFYQVQRIGILQIIGSYAGFIIGSLLIMKITSEQFSQQIGLKQRIGTMSQIFIFTAIFLLIFTIYVHLSLQQRQLQSQVVGKQKSLCQITCYYRLMFDLKSKYCRLAIFIFFFAQGFNFYHAGYQYEMVKHGFSKDLSNSLWALACLPLVFLIVFADKIMQTIGSNRLLTVSILTASIVYIIFIIWPPLKSWKVFLQFLGVQLPYALRNVVVYYFINSIPLHGYSGMFVNLLISLWYLSQATVIHSIIIGYTGFKWASIFGISYQIIMIPFLESIYKWIEEGEVNIEQEMLEGHEYANLEQI